MTARPPTEPAGPSPHAEWFRPVWVAAWTGVAVVGTVALAVLWVGDARIEWLALVGAIVAGAAAVALHHVVVTQDAGERQVDRPDTSDVDVPVVVRRRHLLGGAVIAVVVGGGALAGLLRFGRTPPPGSAWSEGSRLHTITGAPLRPEDIPPGGVVTVWPDGAVGTERAAVMLIRLREEPEPPTRLDGIADDTLVAYSRLCTHAGCAVALYRDLDQALFCPCHQATFDARRGATPTFGPASHPLPQLPIAVDDDGYLVATGDLTARPGPVGGAVVS